MSNEKKTLVIASGNQHKIQEISQIFPEYNVISQREMGFNGDVEETGATFLENAIIKAQTVCNSLNMPILADDSGLCVNALGGEPGVFSARYAGEHGNDAKNREHLLKNLQGIEDRSAYFECAMALVIPNHPPVTVSGRTYGKILEAECGAGGFGYDPIFFSDDLQKSFGEATSQEKNGVSHRFRALMQLKELLNEVL
ncbi:MAG: XTP/dITP diphosphatase [Clostridia bacterium]|nr:XTP/dITP diphosphatase [Clostridia bacterium]